MGGFTPHPKARICAGLFEETFHLDCTARPCAGAGLAPSCDGLSLDGSAVALGGVWPSECRDVINRDGFVLLVVDPSEIITGFVGWLGAVSVGATRPFLK